MIRLASALALALLLSGSALAREKPQIRAVLVGAGSYQNPDAWTPLAGPPHDVERVCKTLSERFEVPASSLMIVTQEAATRENIERELRAMVMEAQPGETLLFYYAGHGFAVPNRDPKGPESFESLDPEEDGMDECLVPIDCPKPDDPAFADKVLRDDFFEEVLAMGVRKVRPDGGGDGSVVFIFDSCHSGTLSRGTKVLDKVERTNLAYRAGAAPPPAPGSTAPAVIEASRHRAGDKGWIVLSACGARQTAKEDPSHGGDFTNALITALEDPRMGPDTNYQELIRMVGSNPYFYEQNPLAEGDRAMRVFGGGALPRQPAISVLSAFDKTVTLDRGRLMGLMPGSKVALYKVGAKSAEDTSRFLTVATIEEQGTDLYRAAATVEGGDVKDLASAVGWMSEQNFGQVELAVFFDSDAESLAPLTQDPVVRKVSRGSEAAVLAWNDGGKLRLERVSGGGTLLTPTDDPTLLRRALRGEARRQYLIRMVNSPQELEVSLQAGSFAGSLASFSASGAQPGSDGLLTFGTGEQALMSITNRSATPLYISVLNFTSGGGVKVLYPYGVEVNKIVSPGQTLAVDVSFDGGAGQEGFKVIGTSQEVDFLFLESQGKERSVEQPEATLRSPFGQLMSSVMAGTRARRPTITSPSSYVAKDVLWVNLK